MRIKDLDLSVYSGLAVTIPQRAKPLKAPSFAKVLYRDVLSEVNVYAYIGGMVASLALCATGIIWSHSNNSDAVFILGPIGAGCLAIFMILGLEGVRFTHARLPSFKRSMHHKLLIDEGIVYDLLLCYDNIAHHAQKKNALALQALIPSHTALLEVSNVLNGRAPQTAVEQKYVQVRLSAMQEIENQINIEMEAERVQIAKVVAGENNQELDLRDSSLLALQEFEEKTGLSSVSQLRALGGVSES